MSKAYDKIAAGAGDEWDAKALAMWRTPAGKGHAIGPDWRTVAIALLSAYEKGVEDSAAEIDGSSEAYGRIFAERIRSLKGE